VTLAHEEDHMNNRRILGWVAFIGVIVLLNVLSHVFDWGMRFY